MLSDEQHEQYYNGWKHFEIFKGELLGALGSIKNDVVETNIHLKELNSKVAKHNEWINRYDIRVAEEIPKLVDEVKDNSKKIYAGIMILAVIEIGIGIGISLWK